MKIVVINPTYNERHNIENLIASVQAIFLSTPSHAFTQLIVDDYSPDGTGDLVKKLKNKYSSLHILKKNHCGLGAAYIAGIQYAQSELRAEVIVEMDADLQHNPALLPRMIMAINNGADVVIASRYVPGGSLPNNWGLFRTINSAMANMLARQVSELKSINDITSGYRAIRVKGILDKIPLKKITANGYAFQFLLLYHLSKITNKISEIPLVFEERTFDNSKVGINYRYLRDVLEYLVEVLSLIIKHR